MTRYVCSACGAATGEAEAFQWVFVCPVCGTGMLVACADGDRSLAGVFGACAAPNQTCLRTERAATRGAPMVGLMDDAHLDGPSSRPGTIIEWPSNGWPASRPEPQADVAELQTIARAQGLSGAWPQTPTVDPGAVQAFSVLEGRAIRRDDEARSESYADILDRAGLQELEGRGKSATDPAAQANYAMQAHGAVFAEVKIDPDLGQVRVTRLVGAFAAGRVINPRLVRSQYYGGMIWGMSFALHEHAIIDQRSGRILNANLADYHIPVNADAPSIEALLVDEFDPHVNALGIKGVGEIGITGSAGAIANAVWHAAGVRVRRFPIMIEELVPSMR